jgi:hypothetical protein
MQNGGVLDLYLKGKRDLPPFVLPKQDKRPNDLPVQWTTGSLSSGAKRLKLQADQVALSSV